MLILLERDDKQNIIQMDLFGNVESQNVLIIDDIADTCGTLFEASQLLKKKGAKKIIAGFIHDLISETTVEKLKNSNISALIFTNSIHNNVMKENSMIKIIKIDIADLLSKWVQLLHFEFLIPRISNGA